MSQDSRTYPEAGLAPAFLFQHLSAQLDALVADEYARTRDETSIPIRGARATAAGDRVPCRSVFDAYGCTMQVQYEWRGGFNNEEINELHAEAFGTRLYDESQWNWVDQVHDNSLGWVVAREQSESALIGFVNVPWDGLVHEWIEDAMVAERWRHRGVGKRVVEIAVEEARKTGCEWMHVDFEEHLRPFYFDACGFKPTNAGLIELQQPSRRA